MFTEIIKPRFHETDALGHINNAVVAEWFEGARTPIFLIFTPDLSVAAWKVILAKLTIDFHRETHFGSNVEIKSSISRIGNSSFDVHQEVWQGGEKTASGTTVMVHFDHVSKKSIKLEGLILEQLQKHFIVVE